MQWRLLNVSQEGGGSKSDVGWGERELGETGGRESAVHKGGRD